MKKAFKILIMLSVAIAFSSCISESDFSPIEQGDARLLEVQFMPTENTEIDEAITNIRYIIINNASGPDPEVEINVVRDFSSGKKPEKDYAETFHVKMNHDKMVAVVMNETPDMASALSQIKTPNDLAGMEFLMDDIFTDSNYTTPKDKGIPLSGIARDVVVSVADSTKASPAKVTIPVEHIVARVEFWAQTSREANGQIDSSTKISLVRSYDKGYIFGAGSGFNPIPTVTPRSNPCVWTYNESTPKDLPEEKPEYICGFFTPERTCSAPDNADKLRLLIEGIKTVEGYRKADVTLEKSVPDKGTMQTLTEIRRNNIYQTVGMVTKPIVFDHTIRGWKEVDVKVNLDKQFFLRVSKDAVYLKNMYETATINISTNYDGADQVYFPGIQDNGISVTYYGTNGKPLAGASGSANWLDFSWDGQNGDLSRNLTLTVNNLPNGEEGYYAMVQITVGNITKSIKVIRS